MIFISDCTRCFVIVNIYCKSLPINVSESAIWNADIRDEVCITKMPNAKLNDLRSNLLIPGSDDQLLKTISTVIPILLIQRPGSSSSNVQLGEINNSIFFISIFILKVTKIIYLFI